MKPLTKKIPNLSGGTEMPKLRKMLVKELILLLISPIDSLSKC